MTDQDQEYIIYWIECESGGEKIDLPFAYGDPNDTIDNEIIKEFHLFKQENIKFLKEENIKILGLIKELSGKRTKLV